METCNWWPKVITQNTSLSTRYRISCGLIFFHSGKRINKYPDSLPISPDACGRKPYPERKGCGFKNIPIRVDGA